MIIREVEIKDASKFLEMQLALDEQTSYMMFEIDERPRDVEKLKEKIQSVMDGRDLILVAEDGKEIIGFISVECGEYRRIKHTGYIVIGILKRYQGQGIGTKFFKEVQRWAEGNSIKRLELTVMCGNIIAKQLYEKNGFKVEGIKTKSMLVNGAYVDEFYMAKLL